MRSFHAVPGIENWSGPRAVSLLQMLFMAAGPTVVAASKTNTGIFR